MIKGEAMDGPMELGTLRPATVDSLESRVARFRKAWAAVTASNETVEVSDYLPPPGDPERSACLVELLKIDLESRFRIFGKGPRIDYYLELYPELGDARTLPAGLILQEYRARQQFGDKPDLNRYKNRFPEQFAELQRLLENSQALEATPSQSSMTHSAPRTPSNPGGMPPSSRSAPSAPPPPTSIRQSATAKVPSSPPSIAGDRAPAAKGKGGKQGLDIGGGYILDDLLGRGAFGEVYRATGPGGFPAAAKIIHRSLDHEDAQKELDVLEVLRNLSHPFLLQTIGYWSSEDQLIIVMELADASLHDRLKQCIKEGKQGIPAEELLRFFRDAAEALDYLHEQGVMHRDIKPANILIKGKHAKVADFGLAKALPITQASIMVSNAGTPAYMAPEAWRGKISRKSDQYSLAATYVELRMNRRIFQSKDMFELMSDQLTKIPDLSGIPEPERAVLLRALDKDHHARYPTCAEFIDALQDAVRRGGAAVPFTNRQMPTASPTSQATPLNNLATRPAPGFAQPSLRAAEVGVEPSAATDRMPGDLRDQSVVAVRPMEAAFATIQLPDDLVVPSPHAPTQARNVEPVQVQPASSRRSRSGRQVQQPEEEFLEEAAPGTRSWLTRFLVGSILVLTVLMAFESYSWSRLKSKVETLKERHNYVQALDAIEDGDPFIRRVAGSAMRAGVIGHWTLHSMELKSTEPGRAAGMARDLLDRCKNDATTVAAVLRDYRDLIDKGVNALADNRNYKEAVEILDVQLPDSPLSAEIKQKQDELASNVLRNWIFSIQTSDPAGAFQVIERRKNLLSPATATELREKVALSLDNWYAEHTPLSQATRADEALKLAQAVREVETMHLRTNLVRAYLEQVRDGSQKLAGSRDLLNALKSKGLAQYDQTLVQGLQVIVYCQDASATREERTLGLKSAASLLSDGELQWGRPQLFDAPLAMGEKDPAMAPLVVATLSGLSSGFGEERRKRLQSLREQQTRGDLKQLVEAVHALKSGDIQAARPLWNQLEGVREKDANDKELIRRVGLLEVELFGRAPQATDAAQRARFKGVLQDLLATLALDDPDRLSVYDWLGELADHSEFNATLDEIFAIDQLKSWSEIKSGKRSPDFSPTLAYLLARKLQNENPAEAARILLLDWPQPKAMPAQYLKPERKQLVRQVLGRCTQVTDSGYRPFVDARAATDAAQCLARLEILGGVADGPEPLATRLLASWFEVAPDTARTALKQVEGLLDGPRTAFTPRQQLLLQLLRSRLAAAVGDGKRQLIAIRAASQLVASTNASPVEFYQEVLAPELDQNAQRSPLDRAALHDFSAEWILQNRDAPWTFGNQAASPAELAFKLLGEACKLDQSNPDYAYHRAAACPQGTAEMTRLAIDSARRFPQHPGAHLLLGNISLSQVDQQRTMDDRVRVCRLTIDHLDRAIQVAGTEGRGLSDEQFIRLFMSQSTAYLWYGNYRLPGRREDLKVYHPMTLPELQDCFTKSKEFAERAIALLTAVEKADPARAKVVATRLFLHEPYIALGHACEDLAYYAQRVEYYRPAVKAFADAATRKPRFIGPLAAQARALLRAVEADHPKDGPSLTRQQEFAEELEKLATLMEEKRGRIGEFEKSQDDERVYLEFRGPYLYYNLRKEKDPQRRRQIFAEALGAFDELLSFATSDDRLGSFVQSYSDHKRKFLEDCEQLKDVAVAKEASKYLGQMDDSLRAHYREQFKQTRNPMQMLYMARTWKLDRDAFAYLQALESGLQGPIFDARHVALALPVARMMHDANDKSRYTWRPKVPTISERADKADIAVHATREGLNRLLMPTLGSTLIAGRPEFLGITSVWVSRQVPEAFRQGADVYYYRGDLYLTQVSQEVSRERKLEMIRRAIDCMRSAVLLAPVLDETEKGFECRKKLLLAFLELVINKIISKKELKDEALKLKLQIDASQKLGEADRNAFRDSWRIWEGHN